MLSTLLITGATATGLARMLNLEGLFEDRRRPEFTDEPTNCEVDMTGTYLSHQNLKEVDMVQSGCSGEVFVDGKWQWTFTVDPVNGIATSSRPDQGEGVLVGGTITWDNGHVWGPVSRGCTGLSQKPMGSVCYGDPSRRVILGNWKTESCESQCERFLNGREGCCNQKNNKNLCWALLGGRTEGVVARAGDVHWQAIDCNQPEYDGDEYKMSDDALNCPPGYEVIDSQGECQIANDLLNIGLFNGNALATTGQATRVGGCFKQETGYWKLNSNVMFNADLTGVMTSANTGDRRICRKAVTTIGCTGLSQKPMGSVCYGDPSTRTVLGNWKTESCESQCERFLNGRAGCCNQKNNKNLCWALLGGRTEGVVADAGDVHWQAIECNQ